MVSSETTCRRDDLMNDSMTWDGIHFVDLNLIPQQNGETWTPLFFSICLRRDNWVCLVFCRLWSQTISIFFFLDPTEVFWKASTISKVPPPHRSTVKTRFSRSENWALNARCIGSSVDVGWWSRDDVVGEAVKTHDLWDTKMEDQEVPDGKAEDKRY